MGRRAKTDKEKEISGTLREDRIRKSKIPSTPDEVKPTITLNASGKKIFYSVVKYLEENDSLWEVDIFLVSQYAYFAQVFMLMQKQMKAKFDAIVSISDKGNEYMSVSYQVMSNAKNQLSSLEKVLGIGPYYRQQIRSFDEEQEKEDEVADLIKELHAMNN